MDDPDELRTENARLREELLNARAWAWAQWHRHFNTTVVDPHATTGPTAAPAWLTSGTPPWPTEPVDTSAVPDQMLATLLGLRDATPETLAAARRRIEAR